MAAINDELARRTIKWRPDILGGFDGDPNSVGAPVALQNARRGDIYINDSQDAYLKLSQTPTSWILIGTTSGNVLLVATEDVALTVDFQDGVGSKTVVEGTITDRWFDQASLDAIQGGATGFELFSQIWNAGPDVIPLGVTVTYNLTAGVHRPDPTVNGFVDPFASWPLKPVQCDGTIEIIGPTPDTWPTKFSGLNVDSNVVGPGLPGSTAPMIDFSTSNPGALAGVNVEGWFGRVREIDITGVIFAHDADSVELMKVITGIANGNTLDIITPSAIFRNSQDDSSFFGFFAFQFLNTGTGDITVENVSWEPMGDLGTFGFGDSPFKPTISFTNCLIDHRTVFEDFAIAPAGNHMNGGGDLTVFLNNFSIAAEQTSSWASVRNFRGTLIASSTLFRRGSRDQERGVSFQGGIARMVGCYFDDCALNLASGSELLLDQNTSPEGLTRTVFANMNAAWPSALQLRTGSTLAVTGVPRAAVFENCAATPVLIRGGVEADFSLFGGAGWQNGATPNTSTYGIIVEGFHSTLILQSGTNVSGTDPNPVRLSSGDSTYADIVASGPIVDVPSLSVVDKS